MNIALIIAGSEFVPVYIKQIIVYFITYKIKYNMPYI